MSFNSVYTQMWRVLLHLAADPYPDVSDLAMKVLNSIAYKVRARVSAARGSALGHRRSPGTPGASGSPPRLGNVPYVGLSAPELCLHITSVGTRLPCPLTHVGTILQGTLGLVWPVVTAPFRSPHR